VSSVLTVSGVVEELSVMLSSVVVAKVSGVVVPSGVLEATIFGAEDALPPSGREAKVDVEVEAVSAGSSKPAPRKNWWLLPERWYFSYYPKSFVHTPRP